MQKTVIGSWNLSHFVLFYWFIDLCFELFYLIIWLVVHKQVWISKPARMFNISNYQKLSDFDRTQYRVP